MQTIDKNNKVIKTYIKRNKTKRYITDYSYKYFKKVLNIDTYKNKTYNKLNNKKIRRYFIIRVIDKDEI